MQKNLKIKILLILLLIILSAVAPYSYARYISASSGDGLIDVAEWNIIINNKTIDEDFDFNLFETIKNPTNTKEKSIMPGSKGSFTLNIKNVSDVAVEYTIKLEETFNEFDIPILYSLEENGEYKSAEEFVIAENEELLFNTDNNKTLTIYWEWPFYQAQNQKDNELGQIDDGIIKVKLNLKVTQKIS